MAEQFDWNAYKGDYVRWTNTPDRLSGVVEQVRTGSYQGKSYPEIVLNTAEGVRILSASQANLMRQLAEDPPAIGDTLTVEYLGEGTARPGQSAPKLFRVHVEHRAGSAPAVADLV